MAAGAAFKRLACAGCCGVLLSGCCGVLLTGALSGACDYTQVAVVVLTASMESVTPRTALFSMDPDELAVQNDAILQALAATPSKAAKMWGAKATTALASASTDDKMIQRAQADESEANELAGDDQAQLQALYSGTFNTGDSLGLHTNSLGNYDTMQALQSLPQTVGSDMVSFAAALPALSISGERHTHAHSETGRGNASI
jgi:hypothetical protein